MGRCEAAKGVASEFRQEDEWEEEEEDDTSSLLEEIPPTLSPLFGGLLLLLVGLGLTGDRSWDERGLGRGRFFKSRLTVCWIWLTEKCVTSACPRLEAEESEEYRSDT